jgi:hypothetical protein
MVLSNASKAARKQALIVNNTNNCGGPKKSGLMGYIGGIGTGGVSPSQRKRFCGPKGTCSKDMNTVFALKCVGNFTKPSQTTYRRAVRGLF